jgi:hypothetical protein
MPLKFKNEFWLCCLIVFLTSCASAPDKERYELHSGMIKEAKIIELALKSLDQEYFRSGDRPVFYADFYDKNFLYGEKLKLLDVFMTSYEDGNKRTMPSGVVKADPYDTYDFSMSIKNEEMESAWVVSCPQGRCLEYKKSTGYLVKGENGVVESLSGHTRYLFHITKKEGAFGIDDLKWISADLKGLQKSDPIATVRGSPKDLRFVKKRLIYRGMPIKAAALSLFRKPKDFENIVQAAWYKNVKTKGSHIYDYESSIR